MKNALVIGGCGFIGSNIVKKLNEIGYKIRVFDNLSTGRLENIGIYNIEFIKGDITNNAEIILATKGIDIIFHLAANIGNIKSLNDPVFDSTVNVIGTLNVLNAARLCGVKKIIYSSSAAIYGELLYQPIDENHPIEPESPYGVSKLAAEKHCLWFGKYYKIDTVCLRYFNVYGLNQLADEYGNVIPKWVDLILQDKPIYIYGDGTQTRDFVNVRDVANANILAANKEGVSGFYNIASGTIITINDLANKLKDIFNKSVTIIKKDFRPGEVKHCKANIDKAMNILHYHPEIDLDNGLTEYINWAKK
jgi:UDP-glucose 4-epimerase